MSLFGNLGNMISNAVETAPGGLPGLMQRALSDAGGLDGVVAKLNSAGLGPKVNSWLGRGDNQPLTADEVRNVLGNEQLQAIAAKLGVPVDQVTGLLAQHLPQAVDQASPNGELQTPPSS